MSKYANPENRTLQKIILQNSGKRTTTGTLTTVWWYEASIKKKIKIKVTKKILHKKYNISYIYLPTRSSGGDIMLPVPAANKFFQLHIFKLNAKKNWWNIKIFKFYLVVRQLGEKKIWEPSSQNFVIS